MSVTSDGQTGPHHLVPPPWIKTLYYTFAAPFYVIAAIAALAPFFLHPLVRFALSSVMCPGGCDTLRSDGADYWEMLTPFFADAPERMAIPLAIAGLLILFGAAAFGTILLFGRRVRVQQSLRNSEATTSGARQKGVYVLYLRPFLEDRRSSLRNQMGVVSQFMHGGRISLEAAISLAIHPRRLIAIGDQFRTIGAEKISVDDAIWFDTFKRLARNAEAVIMIPGYRRSTAQEIDFLFASPEILAKTIFIQPECREGDAHWRDWVAYMEAARKQGLPLPPAQVEGQIFFRSPNGEILSHVGNEFDENDIDLLVRRATRGESDTHGLAQPGVARDRDRSVARGPVSKLIGWLGPRGSIALAMLLMVPILLVLNATAANRSDQIQGEIAANPIAARYYPCARRLANLATMPADKIECARDAALRGLDALPQVADEALARGDGGEAERIYRRAISAMMSSVRIPEDDLIDFVSNDLRNGLGVLFRVPSLEDDADFWERETDPSGPESPLREFVGDQEAIGLLCGRLLPRGDGLKVAAVQNARVTAMETIFTRLGRAYEAAGQTDLALANYRKRLLTIMFGLYNAPPDERLRADLAAAIADLGRFPSNNVPWDGVLAQMHIQIADDDPLVALVQEIQTAVPATGGGVPPNVAAVHSTP